MAKKDKIEELIQREIAHIIQFNLKNPKIGFVTITGIELTNDMSHCKVFVSFLGKETSQNTQGTGLAVLNKSKGYIRTELSKKIPVRRVPELHFIIDESIAYGNKIETILSNLNKEEKE